jgi:outer membrane protein assembly factor BamB
MIPVITAALVALLAQDARERWEEWLVIPAEAEVAEERRGWLRPAKALDLSADPIPRIADAPFDGQRLLVVMGGDLEAWDAREKKRLWRLPSRTAWFGWTLVNSTIETVWPGGPAARARLLPGDRIRAVNGSPVPRWWTPSGFRVGDRLELVVEGTSGERRVVIEPVAAARPAGNDPKVRETVGEDLLVEVDGRVDRVRGSDGRVVWSHRGSLASSGGGLVLVEEGRTIVAVDAATGAPRWTRSGHRYVFGAVWTRAGPIVLAHDERDGTVYERLDPATGKPAWSWNAGPLRWDAHADGLGRIHAFACGRVLLEAIDPDCIAWGGMGGVPSHDGPHCRTYALFDLATGERVWTRRTGGRAHGGTSRHEAPRYLPFDPHLGGPCGVAAGRILWFDVASQELSILDPATLRVERSLALAGALRWAAAPDGHAGVADGNGVHLVDVGTGAVRAVPLGDGERVFGFVGALALTTQEDGPRRLAARDWTAKDAPTKWAAETPSSWQPLTRIDGRRVLVRGTRSAGDLAMLLDLDTGRERWSVTRSNPTFWHTRGTGTARADAELRDPYLILSYTDGIRVYRRSDAPRDR